MLNCTFGLIFRIYYIKMSSSDNSMTMVAGICSFIPYILFIPISIYYNKKLYQNYRNALFIQKRNISITMGLNCAFIFAMIASWFAHLSILYLNKIAITISFSIFFTAYWILLFFLNTKNWMIYYHEKWTYYALDMKWQQIINDKVRDSATPSNWFIKNRHKYGNRRYIFKLFGILHAFGLILLITAQIILSTSDGHPDAITYSIVMIIITIIPYIIFYVFLTFKTPRFNDIFYIHWESQMHARLIVIMGIGLISFNMWYAIDFHKHVSAIWPMAMLCFPFVTLILFGMIMISTVLIIKKTKQDCLKHGAIALMHSHIRQPTPSSTAKRPFSHNQLMTQHIQRQSSASKSLKDKRLSAGTGGRPKISATGSKQRYTLDLILSNKDSFHLFMVHLSKELRILYITCHYIPYICNIFFKFIKFDNLQICGCDFSYSSWICLKMKHSVHNDTHCK